MTPGVAKISEEAARIAKKAANISEEAADKPTVNVETAADDLMWELKDDVLKDDIRMRNLSRYRTRRDCRTR